MKNNETFEISLEVVHKTDKAVLVTEGLTNKHGKRIEVWLPLSQIEGDIEVGKVCQINIPQWLIEKNDFTV